uniref:Uncharacterized protein n=2 Tax=Pyxicephalus adspersus TaxID=30357 RepID=A0AAV2ZS40_PYXAD|nr:TPA: hypothetical protein GDO54_017926 [Pyxicephalus adspersus]
MISSDMPESSTVTDSAQGDVTLAENNVLEKPPSSSNAELHTLVNENLTESEELQLSNDTMTREVPPPLVCDNDSSSPVPPKEETSTLGSTVTQSQAKPEERTDQGLHESDNEDLFKETSPKQKAKQEEEEEEEVSLKGRPPPSPLFGDEDDEEDDLDWLG